MLEKTTIARIGYFIVIGLLATCIMFLGYKVGSHEGDMKALGIEKEYTRTENEDLKETLKSYVGYVEYYRQMFSRGLITREDGMIFVEKNTLIIPPEPEVKEGNVSKAT